MLRLLTVTVALIASGGSLTYYVAEQAPPPLAVPGTVSRAHCGPGDRLEPGLQGQVPMANRLSGDAAEGYWCNLRLVGNLPGPAFANFDTYKNCGYYTNNRGGTGGADGVGVVVDVRAPRHPVQTDALTARAMANAGESLRVHAGRGLLVADHYNFPFEHPKASPETKRALAIYDVSRNCRHPKLLADVLMPTAIGHEGCFQPDGKVYYMAAVQDGITPIDISNPRRPRQLSEPWPLTVHGCSLSDDGKTGYFTDGLTGVMTIVDTSQVQAGKKDATYKVLGRLSTPDNLVQQGTLPLVYKGKPYVFLWSEATDLFNPQRSCGLSANTSNWGYGQMVDVSKRSRPREVSKLQLEVHNTSNCAFQAADRSPQRAGLPETELFWAAFGSLLLYDFHQCRVDRLHEPTILACANFGSGLRVFDIRNPAKVKEIAYYNTGTVGVGDPSLDYAAAPPVIRRDLRQIWWPTLYGGLQVAQFRRGVWPFKGDVACASPRDYYAKQYDLTHTKNCARRR